MSEIEEKSPLKSKKFWAFLVATIIIAGVLIAALLTQQFSVAMSLFMVVGVAGLAALAIGYVINQTALDKFIKGIVGIANVRKIDDDN